MNGVRAFGLSIVAIVLAFATLGAASASATALCTESENPCLEGHTIQSGTAVEAKLTGGNEAVLTSGFAVIKCKESTISGKTTSAGGGPEVPVTGKIESASWGSCTCNLGGTVTTAAENLPWSIEVTGKETKDGTMTVKSPKGSFTCAGEKCIYSTTSASFELKGGTPANALVSITLSRNAGSGFLCSSTATWKATYTIQKPNPLWVSGNHLSTHLCSVEPEKSGEDLVCPTGKGFSGEIKGEVAPKSEFRFESSEGATGTVSCSEGSLVGNFEENGSSASGGGVTSLGFSGPKGTPCSSTIEEEPELEVEMTELPYAESAISYRQAAAPQGEFRIQKAGGEIEFVLKRAGIVVARYRATDAKNTSYDNGPPPELVYDNQQFEKIAGLPRHPAKIKVTGRMKISAASGSGVYVAK
jgi:hypothetical protein